MSTGSTGRSFEEAPKPAVDMEKKIPQLAASSAGSQSSTVPSIKKMVAPTPKSQHGKL
jgi:hypothetical protein